MIPIWVFIVFFAIFLGVLIWERWDYSKLQEQCAILEHFLDKYISKYGPSFGITVEEPHDNTDANNSKQ